ncbi:MAG: hypothetical protein ACEQSX_02810 [Baekduiaceae bacterium]
MAFAITGGLSGVASADDIVGPPVNTDVTAHAGWLAWREEGVVVVRAPSGLVQRRSLGRGIKAASVALGPGPGGATTLVASGCSGGRCDLYRLDPPTGKARRLHDASSPTQDEHDVAVWGRTLVFARRVGGCDHVFTRRLGAAGPSRRVRVPCADVLDLTLRGSLAALAQEERTASGRHGVVRSVSLASRSLREHLRVPEPPRAEGSPLVGQVALSDRYLYVARPLASASGCAGACGIDRIDLVGGGSVRALPGDLPLTSAMTVLGDGRVVYQQVSGWGPRRSAPLVRTSVDPFGAEPHALLPVIELTISPRGYDGAPGLPVRVAGTVTQTVVRREEVVAVAPVRDVEVTVMGDTLNRPTKNEYWTIATFGVYGTARTDADGRWSVVLPRPPEVLAISAVVSGGVDSLEPAVPDVVISNDV